MRIEMLRTSKEICETFDGTFKHIVWGEVAQRFNEIGTHFPYHLRLTAVCRFTDVLFTAEAAIGFIEIQRYGLRNLEQIREQLMLSLLKNA